MMPAELLQLIIASLSRRDRIHLSMVNKFHHKSVLCYLKRQAAYLSQYRLTSFQGLSLEKKIDLLHRGHLYHRLDTTHLNIVQYQRINGTDILFDEEMNITVGSMRFMRGRKAYAVPQGWLVNTLDNKTVRYIGEECHEVPYNIVKMESDRYCGCFGLSDKGQIIDFDGNFEDPSVCAALPAATNFCLVEDEDESCFLIIILKDGSAQQYRISQHNDYQPLFVRSFCYMSFKDVISPQGTGMIFFLLNNGTVVRYPGGTMYTFSQRITSIMSHNDTNLEESGLIFACYGEGGACYVAHCSCTTSPSPLTWTTIHNVRDVFINNSDVFSMRGISYA